MLLLSHFSHVRLCATPETAAHQAPPSLEFSRQEHWSGLPFPSPMRESEKWKGSRSVVSDSSWPHGLQSTRLLHPWDSPGKSTGVGCHCLLQKPTAPGIPRWSPIQVLTRPDPAWLPRSDAIRRLQADTGGNPVNISKYAFCYLSYYTNVKKDIHGSFF